LGIEERDQKIESSTREVPRQAKTTLDQQQNADKGKKLNASSIIYEFEN
jgi:hypothetical protein